MRPYPMASVMIAMLLVCTGCAAMNPDLEHRIDAEAAALQTDVHDQQAVEARAKSVTEREEAPPTPSELPADAGLDDYVAIALRDNPTVQRAIRNVQVLGYQVPQVESLDDPMITLIPPTGNMTQTAGGEVAGGIGVSQKIPFPGKLETRGKIAEQSVRMALDALADARITTVAAVQKAYYKYYLAAVSIEITRQSQTLLRQIRDVAAARYKAGAATQPDVLRAEVELYKLSDDLITLEQQRATARALLNSLMSRPVDAALPPPHAFDLATVDWKLSDAMVRVVVSNPRLARLRDQIRRDLEAVKLARLNYYPDLTAGLSYTFIGPTGVSPVATGSDVWNLLFGLNLPIWWQRLRARVLEGNAQVLASVKEYEELHNQLFFETQDALVKIDTQYRRAVLYDTLIIPRAWQAVEVSRSSYQAGALDFTALVEIWRKWLDSSLSYHGALAELEQRFADLQQLAGVRLPRAAADLQSNDDVTNVSDPAASGPASRSTTP
jgi:cobalt-zinc-cadmium efflux system outer membrane protein